MKDLTQGSPRQHLLGIAVPLAIGMTVQNLYTIVDLYFVSRLGPAALSGVGAAASAAFVVLAITQALGVATTSLIARALGAKQDERANLVFNQSLVVAVILAGATLALGMGVLEPYFTQVSANAEVRAAGVDYMHAYLPGLALQFLVTALGTSLRGAGVARPLLLAQSSSVMLNIALAPVMIAGWGSGHPMGVAGAGMASSVSIAVGLCLLLAHLLRSKNSLSIAARQMRPKLAIWREMLGIGAPAGAEFMIMFVIAAVTHWSIKDFGAPAQAAFSVGTRLLQMLFLPAAAISFAIPAVAGQNIGARRMDRVHQTLRIALVMECGVMLLLVVLCQLAGSSMMAWFSDDAVVIEIGVGLLRTLSWNFLAVGIVFGLSGAFQALGNTWPPLIASTSRLLTFALPLVVMHRLAGFSLAQVWRLSVISVLVQALILALLTKILWHNSLRTLSNSATAGARMPTGPWSR